ncbi:autotransporter outer membrane beta-barrel domain-containing protein [Bartonella sp. B30(2025)]
MIKVLKYHTCLCALTTSIFFLVPNIAVKAQTVKAQEERSCNALLSLYSCDAVVSREDNSDFIISQDFNIDNIIIKKSENISINVGKEASSNSLETLQLKKSGTIIPEILTKPNTAVVLDSVSVTGNGKNTKKAKEENSHGSSVNRAVNGVKQDGFLIVHNSKVNVSNIHGFAVEALPTFVDPSWNLAHDPKDKSEVFVENSNIVLKGRGVHGMHFGVESSAEDYIEGELLIRLGDFQFKNSVLKVPDGTAVYADDARRFSYITLLGGSKFISDRLLEVKNNSFIMVEADSSLLIGGSSIEKDSYAEMNLFNKSQWTVTPGKSSNQRNSASVASSISHLRVVNSTLSFKKPQNGKYQTLHIGMFDEDFPNYAYIAKGNARLLVNAHLAIDGKDKGIKTDKVLIYGDVYGTTKVYIVEDSGSEKVFRKGEIGDRQSVSLIQVYGRASKDSFKLPLGYVALRGVPYRYSLRAYGPEEAKDENRLIKEKRVKGSQDFWDFRLEAEYIERYARNFSSHRPRVIRSVGSSDHPDYALAGLDDSVFHSGVKIRAVLPQIPTYLLLPNALFHAGLMDVNNQNKQLETMRKSIGNVLESSKNSAFFVRGYGGRHSYVSDLSALEYEYEGNLDHNAVETGVLLDAIESAHGTANLGMMGTYGRISLQPQDIVESKKSAFNKWSATAYGSILHNTGFYLDSLFSYGFFKGDVSILERGKTATLKGKTLSASLTGGKAFMIGDKSLVLNPQVQVVYQNLQFDKTSDIDGFDIEMATPDQWVMRVGGRLIKTLAISEAGRVASFGGKLHLVHNFEKNQFVHFKDTFQLGAFGSFLEAGLSFNTQLSPNFVFRGDMTYQHRLSKAGFSGMSFSGGLSYRF